MIKRFFCIAVFFSLFPLFSEQTISAYTEHCIATLTNLHMSLTENQDNEIALQALNAIKTEYESQLASHAVDAEQERLILDSLYLMESYHYLFDPEKNRAELRARMKTQMQKNEAYLHTHAENASKWLYLFTGDVTSFYMTRSMAATLRYGKRVKKLYEKALSLDPQLTNANINVGNWLFYAPKIFGGGLDKAGKRYEIALEGAQLDGEKYVAYIHLSQYWFEKKEATKADFYLKKAEALTPRSTELARIEKLNERGISLFQYNRNQAGIDEKMQESEMDEDDR